MSFFLDFSLGISRKMEVFVLKTSSHRHFVPSFVASAPLRQAWQAALCRTWLPDWMKGAELNIDTLTYGIFCTSCIDPKLSDESPIIPYRLQPHENELPAPAIRNVDLRLDFSSFHPLHPLHPSSSFIILHPPGYNAAFRLCETWRRWDLAIALLHPRADVVSCLEDTDGI